MSPGRNAVVFDWNGTLLADTTLVWRATNEALKAFGLSPVSLARFRQEYVMPLNPMYKLFGCDDRILNEERQKLYDAWRDYYQAHVPRLRLRRGARASLKALKEEGFKTSILSNFTVPQIEKQAKQYGVLEHLDAILANSEAESQNVLHKRSKGERLKVFVEQNETKRALIVGDSAEEIDIAHAYGYLGVAISDGVYSTARLKAAKPDFLIHSLSEIPDIARHVFSGRGRHQ